MANTPQIATDFKLGARVRIKHYQGPPGKIVELRGPLGPGGMNIYRVAIPLKPGFSLIEVRENQLELVAIKPGGITKPRKLRLLKEVSKKRRDPLR